MCGPAAVVGAGLTVGGTLMQNSAANSAARSQQAAINQQTALSAQEFDTRMKSAKESDVRANELVERGSGERMNLESDTFRQLSEATIGQIGRDSKSTDDYYDELARILSQQGSSYDQARAEYDSIAEEERARQAGFRQEADTRVDTLIGDSGTAAFDVDRAAAGARRGALADLAMGLIETPAIYKDAPGIMQDALANTSAAADRFAGDQTGRLGQILAYADAGKAGGRRIDAAGEDLRRIDMNSQTSLSTLPYRLAPSQVAYGNATSAAADARDAAGGALEGKLKLSAGELQRSTIPLKAYADKIDMALADYYKSRLSSESDYASGIIGSSQRYEDTNRVLTNYRVSNTGGSSMLGDLMAGFGSAALSGGISGGGPTWKEVGTTINGWF